MGGAPLATQPAHNFIFPTPTMLTPPSTPPCMPPAECPPNVKRARMMRVDDQLAARIAEANAQFNVPPFCGVGLPRVRRELQMEAGLPRNNWPADERARIARELVEFEREDLSEQVVQTVLEAIQRGHSQRAARVRRVRDVDGWFKPV